MRSGGSTGGHEQGPHTKSRDEENSDQHNAVSNDLNFGGIPFDSILSSINGCVSAQQH